MNDFLFYSFLLYNKRICETSNLTEKILQIMNPNEYSHANVEHLYIFIFIYKIDEVMRKDKIEKIDHMHDK